MSKNLISYWTFVSVTYILKCERGLVSPWLVVKWLRKIEHLLSTSLDSIRIQIRTRSHKPVQNWCPGLTKRKKYNINTKLNPNIIKNSVGCFFQIGIPTLSLFICMFQQLEKGTERILSGYLIENLLPDPKPEVCT